ncbi:MAG TPA: 3'-to-5' oligoribonuclease B [Sulfurospirillum sp. UBA11407]|nr:MAG TPA: 3'-to-5' oligoribonuclease B [Sulfurospirillum sp. UBA11407]
MNYKIYHLSHTDLDGYGCQMVVKNYFESVNYYNSNYGKEINERFNEILEDIEKEDKQNNLILITDLNLTVEQAKELEGKIRVHEREIKLILLDHHKSGQDCDEEFGWYYLDHTRSATQITYDFFSSFMGGNKALAKLVKVINAVDIWLEDDSDFELGKVCLGLISNAKEINRIMFPEENSFYMFALLEKIQPFFTSLNPHIVLDEQIHLLKKEFFKLDEQDDTLSNLVSKYNVTLLSKNKQAMAIEYEGHKGILTYNIGNVSIIGNDFLKENSDFHFFMDVTSRKTISIRANGKVDVSKMAAKLGNGGGHPNASGGLLNSFKDGFIYNDIKKQINDIILSKELKNGK